MTQLMSRLGLHGERLEFMTLSLIEGEPIFFENRSKTIYSKIGNRYPPRKKMDTRTLVPSVVLTLYYFDSRVDYYILASFSLCNVLYDSLFRVGYNILAPFLLVPKRQL